MTKETIDELFRAEREEGGKKLRVWKCVCRWSSGQKAAKGLKLEESSASKGEKGRGRVR